MHWHCRAADRTKRGRVGPTNKASEFPACPAYLLRYQQNSKIGFPFLAAVTDSPAKFSTSAGGIGMAEKMKKPAQ